MWVFLYMLGCTLSFALMTALVKYFHHFPTAQVVFFRCFAALLLPLFYLLVTRRLRLLQTQRAGMHFLRGLLGLSAMFFFFLAYQHIGLVEAQAIGRSKAIFISFFAMLFLKETLKSFRIVAVLVGFIGVLIMLNPAVPKTDPYIFYPVGGALFAGLAMICVRSLSHTEHPLAIVVYFMIFGSMVSFFAALPVWQPMTSSELLLLSLTGVLGVTGQICMVNAYRIGEASVVAPFDYIELIWAGMIGYIVWSEIPTWHAVVGSLIILLCQMLLIRSERAVAKMDV